MEEFQNFINSNRHKILLVMTQNAKILLEKANEAGVIGTSELQTVSDRFQDPGEDHRRWFKHWFWTAKLTKDGESKTVPFRGFRHYLDLDTRNHRRGICLTNTANAFDHYYNTFAHTHVVRPYSIMSIAAALVEITNELDFEGDEQTRFLNELKNQLKGLFLGHTFLRRLFDTDEDQVVPEAIDHAQMLGQIQELITGNDSRSQEKITDLENQLESIQAQNNSLEISLSQSKEVNEALTDEIRQLQQEASEDSVSENLESGITLLQSNLVNEIEFDPLVLEKIINKEALNHDMFLHIGEYGVDSLTTVPEYQCLLDSLNRADYAGSQFNAGYFLRELLRNFRDRKTVSFSKNLHSLISNLFFMISPLAQHVDDIYPYDEDSLEESEEAEEVDPGELSWYEIKIELDELRKQIKSAENLENWENPLMRAVIDRVGEEKIVNLEQWKNDDVIRYIYGKQEPDLDHYLNLIEEYWPQISAILEEWDQC